MPLVAVALTVLTAFPVFDDWAAQAGNFIVINFIPASGLMIQNYILQFEQAIHGLSVVGTAILMITALMTMKTIDLAINDIWRIKLPRKGMSAFMVYWTLLTLGPLFIGGSLALTSYLTSLSFWGMDPFGVSAKLVGLVPFMAGTAGFTLLYMLAPNQKVPFPSALLGAMIAAGLFELAKRGFASYVANFPTYDMIYGALAAIPLFLVWVYLSWLIILLGAEITYCLENWHALKHGGTSDSINVNNALTVLCELYKAHSLREGRGIKTLKNISSLSYLELKEMLSNLKKSNIICEDKTGQWFLSGEGAIITLYDVCMALPQPLSVMLQQQNTSSINAVATALKDINTQLNQSLSITLQQMFNEQKEEK